MATNFQRYADLISKDIAERIVEEFLKKNGRGKAGKACLVNFQ